VNTTKLDTLETLIYSAKLEYVDGLISRVELEYRIERLEWEIACIEKAETK